MTAVKVKSSRVQASKSKSQKKAERSAFAERTGLLMPMARVRRILQQTSYDKFRISLKATVYAAAAAQYLMSIVLKRAKEIAAEKNKSQHPTVRSRHIMLAFHEDKELNKLLANATIQGGGHVEYIHPFLTQRASQKKKTVRRDANGNVVKKRKRVGAKSTKVKSAVKVGAKSKSTASKDEKSKSVAVVDKKSKSDDAAKRKTSISKGKQAVKKTVSAKLATPTKKGKASKGKKETSAKKAVEKTETDSATTAKLATPEKKNKAVRKKK